MTNRSVTWLFRKRRPLGNFSIETSFLEYKKAWNDSNSVPRWIELGHFSEGIINRLRIIREVRAIKSDILHITGDVHFAALAWPRWKSERPKVVLTIHDIGFLQEYSGIRKWIMKKLWVSWPLKCVDHLVTVSDATKLAVLTEAPWFPTQKVTVIPTAVQTHYIQRAEKPQNPKPIALHIGTATNKNLIRHAQALKNLDVHLKIIGEPSEQNIRNLDNMGIDFSWQSKLTDIEMQEAYATCDFLLFASTLEGFGMPIIEAHRVGLPVITSSIAPMDQISGDAAVLCNPHDFNSIRKAILKVLNDEELANEIIHKGFTNAERFSSAKSAAQLESLYSKLFR